MEIVHGKKEWVVESIRAVKLKYGKLTYRANWLGGDEDLDYFSASNFMYSPHLLKKFHLENVDQPGPPTELPRWLKAWKDVIDNYDDLENNSAMNKKLRSAFFRRAGG